MDFVFLASRLGYIPYKRYKHVDELFVKKSFLDEMENDNKV